MNAWPVLSSVFLLGLLGGVHCMAMCGGLTVAVEQRHSPRLMVLRRSSPRRLFWETLLMHLGRITTYAMSGAIAGGLGASAWSQQWLPTQRVVLALGGVLLCCFALMTVLRSGVVPARLSSWSNTLMRIWGRLLARAMQFAPVRGLRQWLSARPWFERLATGLAWGLVPCGMSFSVLALALLAGNAASGALVMFAFGLGTLPNLLAMSGIVGSLRRYAQRRAWRVAAGVLVGGFGLLSIYRALTLPDTLLGQGFCLVW